ncbi:hypothetical protein ABK040_004621 [Willaertia magna]
MGKDKKEDKKKEEKKEKQKLEITQASNDQCVEACTNLVDLLRKPKSIYDDIMGTGSKNRNIEEFARQCMNRCVNNYSNVTAICIENAKKERMASDCLDEKSKVYKKAKKQLKKEMKKKKD